MAPSGPWTYLAVAAASSLATATVLRQIQRHISPEYALPSERAAVAEAEHALSAARQELLAERSKREAERAGRVRAESALRQRMFVAGGNGADDSSDAHAHRQVAGAGREMTARAADDGGGECGGTLEFKVIGRMRSCFRRRFGAPRQGSVVAGSRGMLRMTAECNARMSTATLEEYSHVWLLYVFHENTNLGGKTQVKSKVRPPRLGGEKVGMFATRTPHRPNPIGLSLVRLDKIVDGVLYVSGLDLIDGTPILDVKPYLPPADSVRPELAYTAAWYQDLPPVDHGVVSIREEAAQQLAERVAELEFYDSYADVWSAVHELLRFDIRSLTMKEGGERAEGTGGVQARNASEANFHFDNILVFFEVVGDSHVEVTRVNVSVCPPPPSLSL